MPLWSLNGKSIKMLKIKVSWLFVMYVTNKRHRAITQFRDHLSTKPIQMSIYFHPTGSRVFNCIICTCHDNSGVQHRDHSGYGLSQWKMMLHCNVISHWLSPDPDCSLQHQSWESNHSRKLSPKASPVQIKFIQIKFKYKYYGVGFQ